MPVVSAEFLHEIVYGVAHILEYKVYGQHEPTTHTVSWRMFFERKMKYQDWLLVRMNSDGWDELGNRLEILWGPDRQGRYDYFIFRTEGTSSYHFSVIPDDHGLPVEDKRPEVDAFEVEKYRGNEKIPVSPTISCWGFWK